MIQHVHHEIRRCRVGMAASFPLVMFSREKIHWR
jgi:hypothetical protein